MRKIAYFSLAALVCLGVALVAATDNGIRDSVLAYMPGQGSVKEEPVAVATKELRIWRPDAATQSAARTMPSGGMAPGSGTRLVIGRISSNARKHWPRLEAMAEYLSVELAGRGVAGIDVVMVETEEEMRELFRTGQVDFISETAFQALELTEDGVAEMLMREWKSGVPIYNTLIFTHRDSGIRTLRDLRGRRMVFEDPGSTSGYLVPRAAMARQGLNVTELSGPQARPAEGTVGFQFADDEVNVVGRVHRGISDAGAISNLDWSDDDEVTPGQRADLVVVHETDPIIRSIVVVRSNLDPVLKERLATALERMHESEAGRATLDEYWKVARFDRIEGEALQSIVNAQIMHEVFNSF
ncbi:MAG: phosphate/phosphite/phosphonate ABC transporter substrate-binding protein [Inquilinus sp.]|nr:phosphate/phosphite/phosphonate ABC transporter substrate-binding protein [Inquilinus sp.]